MKTLAILVLVASGCSSLIDTPCAGGYEFRGGACVVQAADVDGGVDAPTGIVVDAPVGPVGPDAPGCTAMTTSDPQNCGSCGHVCTSGICDDGQCVGELPGHIVIVGHDFQDRNAAMTRVLANAVALGAPHDVGVARLEGTTTSASKAGIATALVTGLADLGRSWHGAALPSEGTAGVDVLIVHAQVGDGATAQALGAQWAPAVDALLARGGVIVIVESAGGVSHRFAVGAGLVTATPVDATGTPAFVVDATDAVTRQVVSPYLADTTSVAFPGVAGVIATAAGAVVVHTTRPN